MALKRFIPEQDTFIVSSSEEINFGSDEILELGMTDYGDKPSRILVQFSGEQLRTYLGQHDLESGNYQAILHLNLSEARNLPVKYTLIANTVSELWEEGIGRSTGYVPGAPLTGASWKYRDSELHPWDVEGGDILRVFDGTYAILSGSILTILNGEGAQWIATYEQEANGGNAYGLISGSTDIPAINIYTKTVYTRDLTTDIEMDVTKAVVEWVASAESNGGLVVRFGDEGEVATLGSRISFYSKETHTVYRPYLEIRWNDAIYTPTLQECPDIYGAFSSNLRESYRWGDIARINLAVKSRYPSRAWSTGSIYREQYVLPESSMWGIKNEYTNEMVIDFNSGSTKISADDSGNFLILDTSNLEPERYYRLLIQVARDQEQIVIDNRNIFRVERNGKHV